MKFSTPTHCSIQIMGIISRHPQVTHTNSQKPVCNSYIAVERKSGQLDTLLVDHHKLEIWHDIAISFSRTVAKGDLVLIEGYIKADTYHPKRSNMAVKIYSIIVGHYKIIMKGALQYVDRPEFNILNVPDDNRNLELSGG